MCSASVSTSRKCSLLSDAGCAAPPARSRSCRRPCRSRHRCRAGRSRGRATPSAARGAPAVDADQHLDAQVTDEDRVHGGADSIESLRDAMTRPCRSLAGVLLGSISFAVVVSRDAPARPAQLRLEESRRDQRAAHRQQGRRRADARSATPARAGSRVLLAASSRCSREPSAAAVAALAASRPPVSGVPPLPGRQGRRHRDRRAPRARSVARRRHASRPG